MIETIKLLHAIVEQDGLLRQLFFIQQNGSLVEEGFAVNIWNLFSGNKKIEVHKKDEEM